MPGFVRIASPLHALLKKGVQQNCGVSGCICSVENSTGECPVLAYPQFHSKHFFIIETDASTNGLGAVLAQQQEDGKVHPVAFASRSLSPNERNYAIAELVTLGLVWAAKLFRPYLLGHHCIVYRSCPLHFPPQL